MDTKSKKTKGEEIANEIMKYESGSISKEVLKEYFVSVNPDDLIINMRIEDLRYIANVI